MIRNHILTMLTELGITAAIAAAMVAVLALLLALAGRPPVRRDQPALWVLLFFLVLTQYPVPETFTCPRPNTDPAFWPGNTIPHVIGQIETWGWGVAFFQDRTVPTAIMNFVICAVLGLALAWQGRFSNRAILVFGAALTLGVEFTQLTATWGLFPCPYRKFDADDLVLNFAGVAAGLWLGRRWGWRRVGPDDGARRG